MKTKIFLGSLILISLVACTNQSKQQQAQTRSLNDTIQLIGAVDDSLRFGGIGIIYFINPFFDSYFNSLNIKQIPINNGVYIEKIFSNKPRIGMLMAPMSAGQDVYMSPGDSLTFVIDRDEKNRIRYRFSGENAAHYNYAYMQREAILRPGGYYKDEEEILQYKKRMLQYRDNKLAFLEDYKTKYPISTEFYDYTKANIHNEYTYSLYTPIIEYKQIEKADVPEGYFGDELLVPNNIDYYYGHALWAKHTYDYKENLNDRFDEVYNHVINDFEGEERAYLLSVMIGKYAWKNSPTYAAQLMDAIEKAPLYTQDEVCLEYIEMAKNYYTMLDRPIPEDVQSNTKLTEYGTEKQLTLKEMLKKYEGKAIYLDFWASWCSPCISDIKTSADAKAFAAKNDVVYIYIAHKDETENWKEAAEEYEITKNQYLEFDSRQSPLSEYFKIISISRYILLNKEHKVVNTNAPRPVPQTAANFEEEISKLSRVMIWGDR